ncbi:MAG: ABC transporter permease [Cyclobacteriaceae bacterium]
MKDQQQHQIPKFALWILRIIAPSHKRDLLEGDFSELYHEEFQSKGQFRANFWFWKQLLLSFPSFVQHSLLFGLVLLRSNWKMALRSFQRQAGYSFLNLSGLAIGIACFLAIMMYVNDERSFDKFHSDYENIYRVLDFRKVDGIGEESASAPIPLGEVLHNDFPEQIESVVRFFNFQAPTLALARTSSNGIVKQFNEGSIYFVDGVFFDTFNFPLAQGNPETALLAPNQIVLSSKMAKKYFPDEEAIGKVLIFEDKHSMVVTGVLGVVPTNSHLNFDFLISFSTLDNPEVLSERLRTHWIWNPAWTYVKTKPSISKEQLEAQLSGFVQRHFPESRKDRVKLYLQPIVDIHLHSKLDYEMSANGDAAYIYVFSSIAFSILLISCFNFINLTTSRSTKRAREIGMRKVLGGYRSQLIRQFLGESILVAFLALLVAVPLLAVMIPVLNEFSGKSLSISVLVAPIPLVALIGLALSIGLISGTYPALIMSRFKPVVAIRGTRFVENFKGSLIRKILVLAQFCLSITLIAGTIISIQQLDFLRNKKLGFESDQVVLLPTSRSPILSSYAAFKAKSLDHPAVLALSTAEDIPGIRHQTGGYKVKGASSEFQFPRLVVHDDFANTLGLELAAGRGFQSTFETDPTDAVVINETLLKLLEWDSPSEAIGKSFSGKAIIGVTKDFHFTSLHRPIGPFVLERVWNTMESLYFSARYIAIRVNTANIEAALSHIENQWAEFAPDRTFEYLFLKDLINDQYEDENTMSSISIVFTILSVLIACIGLLGLISSTTERRKKEISIRKVMGASVSNLLILLSSSYVKLVVIAVLIACPLAYVLANYWLEYFAYQIDITVWPFVTSGMLAVLIVISTISIQTVKSALTNPVNSLRNE